MLQLAAWAAMQPPPPSSEQAKTRGIDIELIRNGSRGLLWLEPLVEVATAAGRLHMVLCASRTSELVRRGFESGKPHALPMNHGRDPYFKKQERLTFARVGMQIRSASRIIAHEGYRFEGGARHGAGAIVRHHRFRPARPRWRRVPRGHQMEDGSRDLSRSEVHRATRMRATPAHLSDRMVMEGDPFVLIEGMTIAGLATGRPPASFTCAGNIRMRIARSRRPSPRLTSIIIWVITFGAAAGASISRCAARRLHLR